MFACGSFDRKNPNDPYNTNVAGLSNALIGTWSRDDVDGNQVYIPEPPGEYETQRDARLRAE